MVLTRIECNILTGEREVIDQTAYRNSDGAVLILDSIEPTPEGFEPFNPYSTELTE